MIVAFIPDRPDLYIEIIYGFEGSISPYKLEDKTRRMRELSPVRTSVLYDRSRLKYSPSSEFNNIEVQGTVRTFI
jgi:hypothetical protein